MLKRLIQLFIRTNGRKPNNLEMILLKQKATNQAVDERKIVSMVDRQPVNPNKPILGGMNVPETEKGFIPIRANQYRDLFGKSPGLKKVKKTEAQIKKELEKQNKEAIKRLKDKMKDKDPEDLAGGGIAGMLGEPTYADENHRVPYKDGSKMSRRGFLKLAAGLATIPLVGKYFKWAKPLAKSSKVLTSVPIKNIDGMPLWFKPLVNKVIKEGDDVSKKFATAEREIVHKTKLPDSQTDVIVTQNLDSGNVSVELGMTKHGFRDGHLGQPVRLEYKASENIEPVINSWTGKVNTKGKKTKEEFWVEEAEFTGGHPENVKFEESTFEKFGNHGSNFDEVEKFATGKVTKIRPGKENINRLMKKEQAGRSKFADEYELQKNEGYFDEAEKKFYEGKASGGRVPRSGGLAGMLGE